MVGESDTVSPTFSYARTGLIWIGGFLFIFLTIAAFASMLDQANSNSGNRPRGSNPSQSLGATQSASGDEEPSMGLTPETATGRQANLSSN